MNILNHIKYHDSLNQFSYANEVRPEEGTRYIKSTINFGKFTFSIYCTFRSFMPRFTFISPDQTDGSGIFVFASFEYSDIRYPAILRALFLSQINGGEHNIYKVLKNTVINSVQIMQTPMIGSIFIGKLDKSSKSIQFISSAVDPIIIDTLQQKAIFPYYSTGSLYAFAENDELFKTFHGDEETNKIVNEHELKDTESLLICNDNLVCINKQYFNKNTNSLVLNGCTRVTEIVDNIVNNKRIQNVDWNNGLFPESLTYYKNQSVEDVINLLFATEYLTHLLPVKLLPNKRIAKKIKSTNKSYISNVEFEFLHYCSAIKEHIKSYSRKVVDTVEITYKDLLICEDDEIPDLIVLEISRTNTV